MSEEPIGYRLQWADFQGRRIGMGDKPPKPQMMDFPTKEAALAAKKNLTGPNIVASVTPVFLGAKGAKKKDMPAAWGDMPIMTKRLTR